MSKKWMTFGVKTTGTDKAAKEVAEIGKAADKSAGEVEGLNETMEGGVGVLDGMTGGAASAFKGIVSGAKNGVKAMFTLKGAIVATGVGALVVVVGSLIAYFSSTKKGAEMLQVAMAGLSGFVTALQKAFGKLGELLIKVWESPQLALDALTWYLNSLWDVITGVANIIKQVFLINLNLLKIGFLTAAKAAAEFFTLGFADTSRLDEMINDSKEAIKDAGTEIVGSAKQIAKPYIQVFNAVSGAVSEFASDVKEAVTNTMNLEKRVIRLEDATRKVNVQFAQQRQKIAELKKAGDDITLSIEDRIKATEEAAAIEQTLADNRLRLAEEAVAIEQERIRIEGDTKENLDALAEAQIALSDAQIESLGVQTELLTKVNGLYEEQKTKQEEADALEAERLAGIMERQNAIDEVLRTEKEREILALTEKYAEFRRLAKEQNQVIEGIDEAYRMEKAALDDKYRKIAADAEKAEMNRKIQGAQQALGAIAALNEAFAGDSKKEQKKAFQRNKKIGIVSAVISTAGAVIAALDPSKGGLGIPAGLPGAFAAAATGAAQIATIAKSRFDSGEPDTDTSDLSEGSTRGSSEPTGAAGGGAPVLDLSFLGEGSGSTVQAYVITENVNNQLQADQVVADQTTL